MMVYLSQARNAFNSIVYYKHNTFFRILRSVLVIFPQVFLWKALYAGRESMVGITLEEMITYIVLSRFVNIASNVGGASEIESKMKSGEIGIDFLRPASPRLLFIFKNLGNSFASVLFDGLPVLIISIFFLGGIQPPSSAANFIFFIISLFGALLINVTLEILLGTFSFWLFNVWLFQWFIHFFDSIFSGKFIPLWFLPEWLKNVAYFLPFQAIRFVPVAIYLGKLSSEEILNAFLTQAIWVVALILIQSFLWKKGIKRLVVFGG